MKAIIFNFFGYADAEVYGKTYMVKYDLVKYRTRDTSFGAQ